MLILWLAFSPLLCLLSLCCTRAVQLHPELYTVAKGVPSSSSGPGSHRKWVECHVFIFMRFASLDGVSLVSDGVWTAFDSHHFS